MYGSVASETKKSDEDYDCCALITFLMCLLCVPWLTFVSFPVLFVGTSPTSAISVVYMIRHAEKVHDKQYGLSLEGDIHAICYSRYFRHIPSGPPQIIVSQLSRSERSILTAVPLAFELELPLYTQRRLPLADIYHFIQEGENVLLVTDHENIVYAAKYLGCTNCLSWSLTPNVLSPTDSQLYSSVWRLTFINGQFVQFEVHNFSFLELIPNSTQFWRCVNASYAFVKML
jgi:hypothetical protein